MAIADVRLTHTDRGLTPWEVPTDGWWPATIPGGVHEALLAAEAIQHPYADRHEEDIRWIEERDWWYCVTITSDRPLVAGERARLVCQGLDTVADLWWNGSPLGHHENMFRPFVVDVSDVLSDTNELLIRFSPPLAGLEPPASVLEMGERLAAVFAAASGADVMEGSAITTELPKATLRRKAAFSWGWDFGPRVPSIGVWEPIEVVVDRSAVITGHHVRTDRIDDDGVAQVSLLIEVDAFATESSLTADVVMTSPSGRATRLSVPISGRAGRAVISVPEAELWWTHDLGGSPLYDVQISLSDGDRVLDVRADRIGLRTIELDRGEVPEGGRLFRFVLNGVPIFARGANWLPADMLVGSVDTERYRSLVGLARDGGMTMLRVWGGGVYEKDDFYTACDEAGVLVWQDFMFACTDYPSDDPTLIREVTLEAAHQVRRLRNRASLALWAGNNEVQLIHGFAFQGYEPGPWGYAIFHEILPAAVTAHDGAVAYWPGSPWGEDPRDGFMAVNGVLDGDRHAWEVWHGFDFGAGGGPYDSIGESRHFRRYANDTGKFISEFGIHAAPELATLRRWLPEDQLVVHSPSFDHHNKDQPKDKHDAVLEIVTGLPSSIEEYIDFTMVSQAEGLKFGIEHYRRRQPHCGGTLVWQLNDVWPGFSWSVLDHDLLPKAGYHYLRRVFAPVLASFLVDGDALEVWVSNSGRTPVSGRLVITLAGFETRVDLREELTVELAPGESRVVWRRAGLPLTADRYAWVESPDDLVPANRLFFAEIKDLPFGPSTVRVAVEHTGPSTALVRLTAEGYAYFVHLLTPVPGVRFSDNHLDLRDGDSVVIEVTGLPVDFDL
ncbi:MAG TPA: glycoside hydrolase family 2 protein, partial [Microlunatus sp.]|nr:glycoside hydrolase family 2 protein [Microlunatus sp.]